MPSYDAQNQGQAAQNTLTSSYVNRLATQQTATPSAPNLFGGQAQPASSFAADLQAAGQSAANGYTQGANATSSIYGEQGAANALTHDSETHELFKMSYEQSGIDINQ